MAITDEQFYDLLSRIDETNMALKEVVRSVNRMFSILGTEGFLLNAVYKSLLVKSSLQSLIVTYGQTQVDAWTAEIMAAIKPVLVTAIVAFDNTYLDLKFSEGVYGDSGASTPIQKNDFEFFYSPNGSTVTVTGSTLTQKDGSPLVGGEDVVRLNVTLSGTVIGVEHFEVRFKDGTIFNSVGNAGEMDQSTGRLFLYVQ